MRAARRRDVARDRLEAVPRDAAPAVVLDRAETVDDRDVAVEPPARVHDRRVADEPEHVAHADTPHARADRHGPDPARPRSERRTRERLTFYPARGPAAFTLYDKYPTAFSQKPNPLPSATPAPGIGKSSRKIWHFL